MQLVAGVSYIDSLKRGSKASGGGSTALQNMQKVFGTGHPLTWLLPRTSLPKGALTLTSIIKKGE